MHKFHSGEQWFFAIHNHSVIAIVKQELFDRYPKASLRARIQPVTMDNSWMSHVCQLSLDGTNLQNLLFILFRALTLFLSLIEELKIEFKT